MDAKASTFSKRTLVHNCMTLVHTPSPIHSLHLYPPVLAPCHTQIFTYESSEPPSQLHDTPSSASERVTPKGTPTPCKPHPIR